MKIYYWEGFYKKRNSTKQPASTGYNVTAALKAPTSFWNPVIVSKNVPATANYFKIESGEFTSFDVYYFVNDVVSITNYEREFHLSIDHLATYKTLVGTTYAYILRANDANASKWITDSLNPPTASMTAYKNTTSLTYGSNVTVFDLTTFRFLLSTVGAVQTIDYALNNGIAKTYVMTGGQMAMLANKLCTTNFLQTMVNEFTNPMEAILRCIALPVNLSGLSTHGSENVYFGTQNSQVSANVLLDRVLISEVVLNLPTPMTGQQTYLNFSPYCTATIYLPFVGVCPLDVDLVTGYSLTLKTVIDAFTGDVTYSIKGTSSGVVYQTYQGNCATSVPVSAMAFSALGALSGIMTTIGGVASQNPIMAASGVMATAQSLENHSMTNGSYSSIIGGWQGTDVIVTLYQSAPVHAIGDNIAEEGAPIEERRLINTMSGYVLCRNASVDIPGSDADKEAVNNYLNSGFFYE